MPNRLLILIKHAKPEIIPGVIASQWHLSAAGRAQCIPLAERMSGYQIKAIITSREPKAIETGQIVAQRLQTPISVGDNLHEHDRTNVIFDDDQAQFEAQVANFFSKPSELVYGEETAEAAYERFHAAITSVLTAHTDGNIAIVTHGTVITLFVARLNHIEAFPFWKQLGLPSAVALTIPDFRLLEVAQV